ncbi:methylmalonyl-CoA mutase family protein [Roseivirga sp. BDSF3-8]|uniref:methylmalonyl-CoA mutase family protein n=1 Tax=Roseivirga sp. BDSF3-8 TaxID=3241598 RepID=UPI0035321C4A
MSESDKNLQLKEYFKEITPEEWRTKAEKDLKGASLDKLTSICYEGIPIKPLYTSAPEGAADRYGRHTPYEGPEPEARHWTNYELIPLASEKEANHMALKALENGADGIIFDLQKDADLNFDDLMRDIMPQYCHVSFTGGPTTLVCIKNYLKYIVSQDLPAEEVRGFLKYDPFYPLLTQNNLNEKSFALLKNIMDTSSTMPGFRGLTVSGSVFHESGADTVVETAMMISAVTELIDRLSESDFSPEILFHNLVLSVRCGREFFLEIAKLRALRFLVTKLAHAYGLTSFTGDDIYLHVNTARFDKTLFDPHTNMLRNTTEAMSAIIGGCNSLHVIPYDEIFRPVSSFSTRISRNVSLILKEESYLNKVVDPAAGSYYIESLTDDIANNAWKIFLEMEELGGFVKAYHSGYIQDQVEKGANARKVKTASRRDVFVGVNQYANASEILDPDALKLKKYTPGEEGPVLTPYRGAWPFEQLRLKTEKFVKRMGREHRPNIEPILLSNTAMAKARASFATGFFASAGFGSLDEMIVDNVKENAKKAGQQRADIIVFCGSDEDYRHNARQAAEKFRSGCKGKLLILAGPPEALEEGYAGLFDYLIHRKSNAIEILEQIQEKVLSKSKNN